VKFALVLGLLVAAVATPGAFGAPRVLAIHYGMDVNPVTQDWLNSQLDRAASEHYDAAVIVLGTPSGLRLDARSCRRLSVKVPVLVYVAPNSVLQPRQASGSPRRPMCSRWRR
jgi:membrane-bound ClpP family serine protease